MQSGAHRDRTGEIAVIFTSTRTAADDASAVAWHSHPVHAAIRDQGRAHWYSAYEVAVAKIDRSYAWRA